MKISLQLFRNLSDQLSTLLQDIFINKLSKEYTVSLKNSHINGQYWTVEFSGFQKIMDDDFDNRHISKALFTIQTEALKTQGIDDINGFFKNNDEFLNEISLAIDEGVFSEVMKNMVGTPYFVSIDAKYGSDNLYYAGLLEESVCLIESTTLSCMQSERWWVLSKSVTGNRQLYIPFDKLNLIENSVRIESHGARTEYNEKLTSTDNYIFVIMSFQNNPELVDVYNAIKRSVNKWDDSCKVERIDEIEDDFMITEEILNCIKKSRIVIADITGERPNVYFEIGFARGVNKKMIQMAKTGTEIHFDIKDTNTIFYPNITELEAKLISRLKMMAKVKI
ncbi:TIR domain-containing protein [Ferrovum myxofaciens]|uniref:hypothetical protein n=1 Tax=Ferrovum myxofaciens TaxID=416213 RepID=UPI00068FB157|nr:hypothetical protein [Ferrovum myxofaciens]